MSSKAPHVEHESGSLNSRLTPKIAISRGVEIGGSHVTAHLNIARETHSKCNVSLDFYYN
jgi:hypothetical protein